MVQHSRGLWCYGSIAFYYLFIYFLFSPTPPLAPSLLSRSPSTRFSPGAGAEDRGAGALSLPSTDVGLNLARV